MDDHTPHIHDSNQITQAAPAKKSLVQSLAIPLSIIIGFGLVAAAIYWSGISAPEKNVNPQAVEETTVGEIRPVDEKDHIRGNPNAPIMMIEYSDYDCPFCKSFHETMNLVMSNYGANGQVAWVYRHFPLESRHPSAPYIAQAAECVAEIGGNDAFWKFTDLVFGERGINDQTDTTKLPAFAAQAGVSESAFNGCIESGHTKERVEADLADALKAGGKGTPHTLVLVGGQQGVISGAQSYETVSKILDTLISQMEEEG